MSKTVPIIVDLDGTLVRNDTLYVLAWQILLKKPWACVMLPIKLLNGKAAMKQYMSSVLDLEPSPLSFHKELVDWLLQQKESGRAIVLCTASSQQVADIIADHVGFFDEVIGSDGDTNLSGERKAALLLKRYGQQGFDYCGNASVDLKVWAQANGAIVVNAKAGLAAQTSSLCPVVKEFT